MIDTRTTMRMLLVALAPLLVACGRDDDTRAGDATPAPEMTTDAVRVTEVDLGRRIDANRRIADDLDTDDFAPNDTIYASVETTGDGTGGTLVARWTFEDGQVVDETSRTIAGSGPTVTEFHISRPGGFPVGRYQVEILLNGTSVERKDFTIGSRT